METKTATRRVITLEVIEYLRTGSWLVRNRDGNVVRLSNTFADRQGDVGPQHAAFDVYDWTIEQLNL